MNEILGGTLLPGVVRFNYLETPAGKLNNSGMSPHPINLRELNYLP